MKVLLLIAMTISFQVAWVQSHGRTRLPASRVTAWRVGFNTPAHYTDHETHCGGHHFDQLTPKTCNVCGGRPGTNRYVSDRYNTGTITGNYKSGGTIKFKYEMTANHKGYFLAKLCVNDRQRFTPAQSCFDKLILKTTSGKDTYPVRPGNGIKEWEVKIPAGISCSHCILQLDWKCGNQGCQCFDLKQCQGCRAEHFVSCSDIRIKGGPVVNPNPKNECPKTHKYAYSNGQWCCQTNKDCNGNDLKMDSQCCQYSAYKECPTRKTRQKCSNHPSVVKPPPGPPSECKDEGKHCPYWKDQGYCMGTHSTYMKKYCKKSCDVC